MVSGMKTALMALALMIIVLPAAVEAQIRNVHNFACSACHRSGVSYTSLVANNMCLACHTSTRQAETMVSTGELVEPTGIFAGDDASDAMGNSTGAAKETSHHWAVIGETNPAAGAQPPSQYRAQLDGRYRISQGKVICSRCHNPHARQENVGTIEIPIIDTKSLKVSNDADELCRDCHRSWVKTPAERGLLSHPMVDDYAAAAAGNSKLNPTVVNVVKGDVRLVNGSVSCSSCHAPHFVDSNSSTDDGKLQSHGGNTGFTTGLLAGDGKLLRTDGPLRVGANPTETAQLRSNLCQACHTYQMHGTTNPIGCLDCHSGHSYNNGSPNYFVLRGATSLPFVPALSGPGTVSMVYDNLSMPWQNSGNGYCEACHDIPATIAEHNTGLPQDAAYCSSCHTHEASSGSFGGSCNSCHGYAPTANTAGGPTGYAYLDNGTIYSYALDANVKDESQTAHGRHASAGNYSFDCTECHSNFTSTGHPALDNNYQDVAFAGGIAAMNGIIPTAYNKAGSGSCATLYCHSDGVNPARTVAGPNPVAVPAWLNGTATTCASCHNTGTSGTATVHNTHTGLTLGGVAVTCGTCHADTWVNATTVDLTSGAHVDGDVDVVFDTALIPTAPMNQVAGTCAVYCHSNGTAPVQTPDWDDVNTGNCGDCHDADGTSGDSVAISSGSHTVHLNNGLTCNSCHTHDGSAFGGDHINGVRDVTADVCFGCHGATSAGTGHDAPPVWGNAGSVSCETCHMGSAIAVINTRGGVASYMDKSSADATGHNKASGSYAVSGNLAANQNCASCHNAAAAGHFDGDSVDDRLNVGFSCTSCHTTMVTHQAKSCATCHDAHGSTNIFMVRATSSSEYTGTVVFTALTGANSYDEVDAANGDDICATCHIFSATMTHNTSTNQGGAHNEGTNCFTCHLPHTEATGAFAAGGGDSCDSCHGYPPNTAAHAVHAPDAAALDTAGLVYRDGTNGYADATACEYCHDGTLLYTYNPSDDRTSATPGRVNHGAGEATQDGTLGTTVGYTGTNCTSACHIGVTGVSALWTDTSLGCDACHYSATGASLTALNNTAASNTLAGSHGAHFDISATVACSDCHVVPGAGDTAHITDRSGADEAAKVQGMAVAVNFEATLTAAALGSGSDPTTGAANATCNNAACHNPSAESYVAEWSVSTAACNLCHGDMTTRPATGSHSAHLNAAATFGIATITCTSCHADNIGSTAHADGSVSFTTSPAVMGYTGGAEDVQGTMGSCSTTTCHNDGNALAVVTPAWGTASANCSICHAATPSTAKHAEHVGNLSYVAGGCSDCHPAATAATHINAVKNLDGAKVVYTSATQTCTNSCHIANTSGDWTAGGALACADCHAVSQIGAMGSGVHAEHTNNTFPVAYETAAANNSTAGSYQFNCANCHGNSLANHMNTVNNVSLGDYLGGNCNNNACHQNGNGGVAALVASWTTGWIGDDSDTCNNCHGNAPATGAHAVHAVGIHSDDIYTGTSGQLATSASAPSAHGDGATSTVLNCNTCHFSTTTAWGNPYDSRCSGCHNPGTPVSQGDTVITISDKSVHVDGSKTVAFQNIQFKSKAQLRGDVTSVAELNNNWTRVGTYKASNSYDLANTSLSNDSFADATCTNACHNSNPITWVAPTGDCSKCHTALPQ